MQLIKFIAKNDNEDDNCSCKFDILCEGRDQTRFERDESVTAITKGQFGSNLKIKLPWLIERHVTYVTSMVVTLPSTQCADVITHCGVKREPLQWIVPTHCLKMLTSACQRHSPGLECCPPTIRLDNFTPQSLSDILVEATLASTMVEKRYTKFTKVKPISRL